MITNRYKTFTDDLIQEAIKHARFEWPFESCGAVINGEYIPFKNMAQDRGDSFLINSKDFDRAYQEGRVECVIHSHNDSPMASVEDQQQQQSLDVPFGIINLKNNSAIHAVFWGESLPVEPIKGREFFFGVWDCYAIVRDFIREEFGLVGPNPPRRYAFWDHGESIFEEYTTDAMPFKIVPKSEAKANDILFYNIHGTPYFNHCAVMRENGLALHHFQDQVSRDYPIAYQGEFLHSVVRFDPEWKNNPKITGWEVVDD